MTFTRIAAAIAAVALAACRSGPPPAVDPGMALCIPAGTRLLAGFDLDRLRASPPGSQILATRLPFASPLGAAARLILASDGKNMLAITRGDFRRPPAGATLVGRNLAVSGPAESVRAALAQHGAGRTGAPGLLALAEAAAPATAIWAVVQGGGGFPLTGNAANLNRLLHDAESVTVGIRLNSGFAFDAAAVCRDAVGASRMEESLRAFLTLTTAQMAHQPDLAAALGSVQLGRQDRTVHAAFSANPEAAQKLLGLF